MLADTSITWLETASPVLWKSSKVATPGCALSESVVSIEGENDDVSDSEPD